MDSAPKVSGSSMANGYPLVLPRPSQPDDEGLFARALEGAPASGRPRSDSTPGSLRRHLVAGDVIALSLAWGPGAALQPGEAGGPAHRAARAALAVAVTLLVMQWGGLYRARVCALRSLEAVRATLACFVAAWVFLVAQALEGHVEPAWAAERAGAGLLGLLVLRWRFRRWLRARRGASKHLRTIVIAGANDDAEALFSLLAEEPELGFRVSGVAGPSRPGSPLAALAGCEAPEGLADLARETGANGVIVVASAFDAASRARAVKVALAAGLHVQVWPGIHGLSSRRLRMSPASGVPLLYIEPRRVTRPELAAKRAVDIVLGTLTGLLALPVVGLAALAIKVSDGGPVLYRSKRVGRYGEPIEILKLRTMVPNASELMAEVAGLNERRGGPLFKASADPRVTKVGRLLRATSIDELPQLWNVLTGSMSLVGPRPALLDEVGQFDDELHRRHEMRPGMTGLWQVEARDNPSFSAYRRLDLSYVDDWSLTLDLAILASTAHELAVRAMKAIIELLPHCKRRRRHPAHTGERAGPVAVPAPR
jgi:exopolysaccharide biosynthesis polyprenyl glycosylphosphotransferase